MTLQLHLLSVLFWEQRFIHPTLCGRYKTLPSLRGGYRPHLPELVPRLCHFITWMLPLAWFSSLSPLPRLLHDESDTRLFRFQPLMKYAQHVSWHKIGCSLSGMGSGAGSRSAFSPSWCASKPSAPLGFPPISLRAYVCISLIQKCHRFIIR